MTELLEVRDLHTDIRLRSGTVNAVDGVSFSINRGETLGLVGESGCGKTMTGMSIMRLLPPGGRITSGLVRLEGEDLASLSEEGMRRIRGNDVAMVFQDPMTSLNPVMTIGHQIAETIRAHQRTTRQAAMERAREVLGLVGLPRPAERLDEYPHQLSGGLRQRTVVAMALACEPKLIIADEPTTALDVTIQAQILELMKALTRRLGVALVIITHNLGVVARYANRVNVMYAGRIVESGAAADIYHRPLHPYTMALLRSVPRLDRPRQARLDPVEGQPPDLTRLDAGCAFRPRCRFAVEICATARPALEAATPGSGPGTTAGHLAACFRSHEIGAAGAAA